MAKIEKSQRPPFAKNISERRKALGLSQAELAHKVGTHRNTIADIERGTSEGRPDTRQAIASVLGRSVGELFASQESQSLVVPEAVRKNANELFSWLFQSDEQDLSKYRKTVAEQDDSIRRLNAEIDLAGRDIVEALAQSSDKTRNAVRVALGLPEVRATKFKKQTP